MIAFGVVYGSRTPYDKDELREVMQLSNAVLGWLLVLQAGHAVAGMIVLKGRRWAAFGVGLFAVLAAAWIALHSGMAATGVWL